MLYTGAQIYKKLLCWEKNLCCGTRQLDLYPEEMSTPRASLVSQHLSLTSSCVALLPWQSLVLLVWMRAPHKVNAFTYTYLGTSSVDQRVRATPKLPGGS